MRIIYVSDPDPLSISARIRNPVCNDSVGQSCLMFPVGAYSGGGDRERNGPPPLDIRKNAPFPYIWISGEQKSKMEKWVKIGENCQNKTYFHNFGRIFSLKEGKGGGQKNCHPSLKKSPDLFLPPTPNLISEYAPGSKLADVTQIKPS